MLEGPLIDHRDIKPSCRTTMTFAIAKAATSLAAAILLGACSDATDKADAPAPLSTASATRISKPQGWTNDNVFLGRWQGNSTAGRAVLDVLTLEPNRVRWGNAANGSCDSDYSVEQMPWGRHGRFPDQLVPPTQPTDLVYGVVRLTLQPQPCNTGVAVIQLAKPMDGSGALQVVTYDAEGAVRGNYPDLSELRADQAPKQPQVVGGSPPIVDTARFPLTCTLNAIASTCRTEPAANDGFTVIFSHAEGPTFTFTPVGAPTTDRREMVDGTGQRWAMTGHHTFELEEIGGYGNRITVSKP